MASSTKDLCSSVGSLIISTARSFLSRSQGRHVQPAKPCCSLARGRTPLIRGSGGGGSWGGGGGGAWRQWRRGGRGGEPQGTPPRPGGGGPPPRRCPTNPAPARGGPPKVPHPAFAL